MKCFGHPESAAVGLCKHCSKGVCIDCAVETEYGLACSEVCAEQVVATSELIDLNIKEYKKIGKTTAANRFQMRIYSAVFIVMGAIFAIAGANDGHVPIILLGLVMLVAGIATFIQAMKTPVYFQDNESSHDKTK